MLNFKPIALNYSYEEYEPFISAEIMQLHYEKHYLGYIKNLNSAFQKYPHYFEIEIEKIMSHMNDLPEEIKQSVRNNGGGFVNHTLFWKILNPVCATPPSPSFKKILQENFENIDVLKEQIIKAATTLFGSGWAWLIVDKNGDLKITTTSNQDTPLMDGNIPILGLDVWEHSYYLQYKNVRANYLEELWKIIDWQVVEEKYNEAINTYL